MLVISLNNVLLGNFQYTHLAFPFEIHILCNISWSSLFVENVLLHSLWHVLLTLDLDCQSW
jgi:hypothetical protein